MSNKLLKLIAPVIIEPLQHLINLSLKTGFVPDQIKISKIIPIYKPGSTDKQSFNNYRPISILSSWGKLFEKIVCVQLVRFLDTHNILYKHQYGI